MVNLVCRVDSGEEDRKSSMEGNGDWKIASTLQSICDNFEQI